MQPQRRDIIILGVELIARPTETYTEVKMQSHRIKRRKLNIFLKERGLTARQLDTRYKNVPVHMSPRQQGVASCTSPL